MPYVSCPDCRQKVFTAARYSTRDACPNCGTTIPVDAEARSRRVHVVALTARELRAGRRERRVA